MEPLIAAQIPKRLATRTVAQKDVLTPLLVRGRAREPALGQGRANAGTASLRLSYESDYLMSYRIQEQNKLILDFAQKNSVQWKQHHKHNDIFVGTHRPDVD